MKLYQSKIAVCYLARTERVWCKFAMISLTNMVDYLSSYFYQEA